MRNRMKRFAIPIVSSHYGVNPSENDYMQGFRNAPPKQKEKLRVAYVEQKVAELVGSWSPFLYGCVDNGVFFIVHLFRVALTITAGTHCIRSPRNCRVHREPCILPQALEDSACCVRPRRLRPHPIPTHCLRKYRGKCSLVLAYSTSLNHIVSFDMALPSTRAENARRKNSPKNTGSFMPPC